MPSFEPIPASAARQIATYSLIPEKYFESEVSQAEHRLRFVNFWGIEPGSRVLEIGCGQGTCTAVLAEAVGPTGHVDGVDPGAPDYGAPTTLAEAQAYISKSAVGDRISWHCAEPTDFLAKNPDLSWDYVVLAHCSWYFPSPDVLKDMLAAFKGRAKSFLVAEYALKASEPAAWPHVLAAMTRASLEAHNKQSDANIRCMFSPTDIKKAAEDKGWTFDGETNVVPSDGLLDGHWEVIMIEGEAFLKEVDERIQDEQIRIALKSSRDAVLAALGTAGVEKARTMDVWVAKFN